MILASKQSVSVIHKHYSNRGKPIYVDVRATPVLDNNGSVIQIIESHRDITKQVEMEEELQLLATTDRLTQISNRMKFDDELQDQVNWAKKTNNPLGLIMFDIDHFKEINDTYGHDVGDQVLRETVELAKKRIRSTDFIARWGGEEFMIIAPLTGFMQLKIVMENLRKSFENHKYSNGCSLTASIGGSVMRKTDSLHDIVKRVDSALYQSKQCGRNRCTILE